MMMHFDVCILVFDITKIDGLDGVADLKTSLCRQTGIVPSRATFILVGTYFDESDVQNNSPSKSECSVRHESLKDALVHLDCVEYFETSLTPLSKNNDVCKIFAYAASCNQGERRRTSCVLS